MTTGSTALRFRALTLIHDEAECKHGSQMECLSFEYLELRKERNEYRSRVRALRKALRATASALRHGFPGESVVTGIDDALRADSRAGKRGGK